MSISSYINRVQKRLHWMGVTATVAFSGDFQFLATRVTTATGLIFVDDSASPGRVCFAESPDLRDEFKTVFTRSHLFDFLHALLYSKSYRQILQINFVDAPLPADPIVFWKMAKTGERLLLQPAPAAYKLCFPVPGDNKVSRVRFEITETTGQETKGHIYINNDQYFETISLAAWQLSFAGITAAEAWLNDRINQQLSPNDILQYQKLMVAANETAAIVKEIDALPFFKN